MTRTQAMSEEDPPGEDVSRDEFDEPFTAGAGSDDSKAAIADLEADIDRLEDELYRVSGELSRFEEAVETRTLRKPDLEADLRRYVRERMRRSRARGWGPYLVLLYGTIMTVAAFVELSGGWAIFAMVVIWLSTLGLYVVMLGVGAVLSLLGVPRRLLDAIARRRS